MDLGLAGKTALVTGGSSGIGLATVETLLAEGANVALCARNGERLSAVAATLAARFGDRVLAQVCDVLDEVSIGALRAAVLARFGGLDILVNNAGQGRVSTFAETNDAAWTEELNLKFFSVIRPTRAFLPDLKASGAGSVVIVNSLLAKEPQPHMVCTSAARAGIQNLARSLTREFAPTVRVNTILIGIVDSGQWERRFQAQAAPGQSRDTWMADLARDKGIPLGRLGQPSEPARAIVFLASPAAGFITGAALEVSGGISHHV